MSIAKEIQQRKFRSEYHELVVNVIFSGNWMEEKIRQLLEKEKITPQQYNILCILRGNKEPMSTLQIRSRMLDKMSDTSRIVNRLMKKGWVEKKKSHGDKRLVDITISKKGSDVLRRLDERHTDLDSIVTHLSKKDANALNRLLDKMREQ